MGLKYNMWQRLFFFFKYLSFFLKARAHPWLPFCNSVLHSHSDAQTCPTKVACAVPFLLVERKHNRFVLPCVSAFHTRAISGGYGEQPVCISLFSWCVSLKPHHCGHWRLEGLKSIQPSYVPQNSSEGSFEEPTNQISLSSPWVLF